MLLCPVHNRSLDQTKFADKEMVRIRNPYQLLWIWCSRYHGLYSFHWAIRIVIAAEKELRLAARAQISIGISSALRQYGKAKRDQAMDPRVTAAGLHADIGAEGKSSKQNGTMKFLLKPIKRSPYILLLAKAVVMQSLAAPSAAKVKAQHGETQSMEGLHRVVNHLIVHGAPAHRVGMADQGAVRRVIAALVQQGFQRACGASQVKGSNGGRNGLGFHRDAVGIILRARGAVCWKCMPIDPIALTRQLVDIESISENEAAVGHFLFACLTEQGFQVERMPVPQSAGRERFNVYAGIAGETPDVVLSTHMDTVPPFFPSWEDDQYIYGRGSCDAKGIIAAQVAAAERLRGIGVRVALLFLVGEERGSHGARVANTQPKGSRFLINGEPTDNRLALASKGAINAVIRARGKMGHSAYPELGESAIHKLIPVLERILHIHLPSDPEAGPSTLNIGLLEGGHAPNVIADEASATILVRLVGPSEKIHASLLQAMGADAELEVTVEIPFQKFKRIDGLPTMVAAFTTDIPALSKWGEPLLLGPGSIHVAHTPQERLAKQELMEAVDLYTQIAHRLVQ